MSTGPERASGNDETETRPRDGRNATGAPVSDRSSGSISRRQALAAVGSLSLGATAGCLDSVRALVQNRVPVEPEDPGDERHGTPSEFYFFLEENGISVDELYHDTAEDDLILFYESDADDRSESENEIWIIYRVFSGGLVDRGSEINHLYTEVVDESRFDGQVEGWGVNAEWAEDHLAGEIGDLDVWNAIINTKVYDEGSNPYILSNDDDETDDDATGDDEAFGGETDDPVVGDDEDESEDDDGNGAEDEDVDEDGDESEDADGDGDETEDADTTDETDGDDSDDEESDEE